MVDTGALSRIYLSPPDMSGDERARLLAAFDSNWITTMGSEVDGFERDVAALCGAEAAVALASGTAALHLALMHVGAGPGDEVWVSDLTFAAPANAVSYVGAQLRLIDSERETWNMDPDVLDDALDQAESQGRLPRAVIVVDIYGQCAQLDRLVQSCSARGVAVIEDAAEALGATWLGRGAGTWGELGAFSFNGNKIITTGGGGMLVGSAEAVERARYLAQQARQPVLHYEHTEVGYNYRLSNLLAAVGRGQVACLEAKIRRRHEVNDTYRRELADIDGVSFMPWDDRGGPNGWLTVALLDPDVVGVDPPGLCAALEARSIEARPAWKPMHLQPVFRDVPYEGSGVSSWLYERGVCLPSGSSLGDADLERVVADLRSVLVR